jgi:hypothetical protein
VVEATCVTYREVAVVPDHVLDPFWTAAEVYFAVRTHQHNLLRLSLLRVRSLECEPC